MVGYALPVAAIVKAWCGSRSHCVCKRAAPILSAYEYACMRCLSTIWTHACWQQLSNARDCRSAKHVPIASCCKVDIRAPPLCVCTACTQPEQPPDAIQVPLQGIGRLADSAVGDLWLPVTAFIFAAVSFGIGLQKLISGPTVITTLSISVAWIVYGMVPPFLLLHYTFIGRGASLAFWSRCAQAFPINASTSRSSAAVHTCSIAVWLVLHKHFCCFQQLAAH